MLANGAVWVVVVWLPLTLLFRLYGEVLTDISCFFISASAFVVERGLISLGLISHWLRLRLEAPS